MVKIENESACYSSSMQTDWIRESVPKNCQKTMEYLWHMSGFGKDFVSVTLTMLIKKLEMTDTKYHRTIMDLRIKELVRLGYIRKFDNAYFMRMDTIGDIGWK